LPASPQVSIDELLKIIRGPDFPTAGVIIGTEAIERAYRHGKAKIILQGKANIETTQDRESIVITELPYQVNKAKLIETIAGLSRERKIL